jgi:SAM-dependent methyltransferase
MTATFGERYANLYDAMYAEKDYARECDTVEKMFARYADGVRTVLDLGCGTGNHALQLASRGYAVTGIDRSMQMLAIARAKADDADADVCFIAGDVRYADAQGPHDAALMMFAVLGYQHDNADVRAAFANTRRMLRPGGLFIFDAWYGPGVLADPPAPRVRTISAEAGAFERAASAEIDARRHLCTVRYTLTPLDGASDPSYETHVVRYFFPMELEMYLEACGFRLLRLGDFDRPDDEPGGRTWNALAVAQAV